MYNYDRRPKQASSADEAKKLDTKKLHTETVKLLKSKKLGPARAYLDELATRKDNKKAVPSIKELGLTGPFADTLQDRIEQVNTHV